MAVVKEWVLFPTPQLWQIAKRREPRSRSASAFHLRVSEH